MPCSLLTINNEPCHREVKAGTCAGFSEGKCVNQDAIIRLTRRHEAESIRMWSLACAQRRERRSSFPVTIKAEVEAVEEALKKSVAKTKAQMKEKLTRAIYEQLNGNVAERRALAIQMRRWGTAFDEKENKIIRDFYDKNIVRDYNLDPQKVDQGLLGMAENRVGEMLRRFQDAAPIGKPLGAFPVGGNQNLRQLVEEEGRQTTRETLEGDPAGLDELSFMSNPELKKQVA